MVQYTRRHTRRTLTETATYVQIPTSIRGYSEDIKNATSGMCPRKILLFVNKNAVHGESKRNKGQGRPCTSHFKMWLAHVNSSKLHCYTYTVTILSQHPHAPFLSLHQRLVTHTEPSAWLLFKSIPVLLLFFKYYFVIICWLSTRKITDNNHVWIWNSNYIN